ncbi:hypothetical protein MKEN_00873200 [Mycena kentingensis (nom. inval.)]|nr:hypothetical protein MKEN_00873200 [Mycena kentingensis (nom. inval.)]
MSSPSGSTTSLSSTSTTATLVSAATPSPKPQPQAKPKDFAAAFGRLQAKYGFGGQGAAAPAQQPTVETPPSRKALPTEDKPVDAFAQLQLVYGFGGGAPNPIPASRDETKRKEAFGSHHGGNADADRE